MAGGWVVGDGRQVATGLKTVGRNSLVSEVAPLVGLYWLYSVVRWLVAFDNPHGAFGNAIKIISLERELGLFLEPLIQQTLIHHALAVVHVANWFYTLGYFPVLILTGLLLYRFDRERYRIFKLAFLLGLGLAVIGYSFFPLAPPRMLARADVVDTQELYGAGLYNQKSVASLYNPYAAMPSMHFGFALLIGVLAFSFDQRFLKVMGIVYPSFMALVIVTTGHHYFLDILGGAAVVGLAYGVATLLSRSGRLRIVPRRSGRDRVRNNVSPILG